MSKLTDLIAKLCPEGVEFLKLINVATIKRGDRITKKDLTETGKYPVMSGGVNYMGRFNNYNREPNTITISSYGVAGYVDFVQERFWANDVCLCVFPSEKIDNKYLYYTLKNMQDYLFSRTTKAIPDHIPTEIIEELRIPVPPLPVQREIVRILDSFTSLTAELTAELTARKKQYEYYRDQLLTFDECQNITGGGNRKDGVQWKTLGEIATIDRGGSVQRKDFTEAGFPCIHYGQIYTYYGTFTNRTKSFVSEEFAKTQKKASKGDIIIAITSENVEDVCKCVAWLGEEDIVLSGHIAVLRHDQNPKFLAYYFQTSMFFDQKVKRVQGTKVYEISPNRLKSIRVPIPSLEEQARIVSILDRFDALCNDLTSGLPAEIEARRKQYEYYRDKLLTFQEIES